MTIEEKILLLQELNTTISLVEDSACIPYAKKCFIIDAAIKDIGRLLTMEVNTNGK